MAILSSKTKVKTKVHQYLSAAAENPGDYRFAWGISFLLALIFSPLIVLLKHQAPGLILIPLLIGAAIIVAFEVLSSGVFSKEGSAPTLIALPDDFKAMAAYEKILALEIRPRKKVPK